MQYKITWIIFLSLSISFSIQAQSKFKNTLQFSYLGTSSQLEKFKKTDVWLTQLVKEHKTRIGSGFELSYSFGYQIKKTMIVGSKISYNRNRLFYVIPDLGNPLSEFNNIVSEGTNDKILIAPYLEKQFSSRFYAELSVGMGYYFENESVSVSESSLGNAPNFVTNSFGSRFFVGTIGAQLKYKLFKFRETKITLQINQDFTKYTYQLTNLNGYNTNFGLGLQFNLFRTRKN